MDITSIIAGIPLFEGLSPKQCNALGAIAVRKYYSRGQNFFAEGDEGIGFYIILSGKVKIFKLSPEGKEQIFHILEAPRTFRRSGCLCGRTLSGLRSGAFRNPCPFLSAAEICGAHQSGTLSCTFHAGASLPAAAQAHHAWSKISPSKKCREDWPPICFI